MIRIVLLASAASLAVLDGPAGQEPARSLVEVEQKLHGAWDGYGPCDGELILKPDQTYERRLYGPGGISTSGTWALRWDALPPTLALTCKTSDDRDRVNKAFQWEVMRLNEGALALKLKNANERHSRVVHYERDNRSKSASR